MSKFIRLSNFLFNLNDIQQIVIKPNKYLVHVTGKQINGYFGLFGIGYIQSYTNEIEVCKTAHSSDYKIMTDWINTHYPVDKDMK